YGIVQGLAEFLPISSSAHLTLLPWAMGWEDLGLSFDVALHWGTLAAVLVVFWRDWIRLISAALRRGSDTDRRLFWCLVISAVPLGLFEDFTRDEIARFSFLMSTPIIFGAGLVKLPRMLHEMRSGEGPVTWAALAVGFVASAVVGTFVIRWMLDYLRRRTYA